MYDIPQYEVEIHLISNIQGLLAIYKNYKEFIEDVNYLTLERHLVTTFKDYPLEWWKRWERDKKFKKLIVRDKFGSVYSRTEILNDKLNNNQIKRSFSDYYRRKFNFIYRKTPVPYTGKNKWHFSDFYKVPKIAQERRWYYAYPEFVRGKRRPGYLPDAYDDKPRADVDNRKCCKQRRKHQWK